jgi:hypothetical protein
LSVTYIASNPILNLLFGATALATNPGTFYMGLSTTTILADGSGATEPTGGAYARVALANNKTTFSVASSGTLTNLITISFAESTLSWGTITYVFLASAGTTGVNDIWYFEALPTPKAVASQTTVSFSPSAMTVSLTN